MNELEKFKSDIEAFKAEFLNPDTKLSLQTSGSTGTPKTIWADKAAMWRSAKRTNDFLKLVPGDIAVVCLPLQYIAGKMMVVRAIERQLDILPIVPASNPLLALDEQILHSKQTLLAITPHQLHEIIANPVTLDLLHSITHVIIGGAAISLATASRLASFPGHYYATYGMTETYSHIALRRLNGSSASDSFMPLPGVQVRVAADGCLAISDPATNPQEILTGDLAMIADGGSFKILGRKDNVVNSGGMKLHIESLEQQLSELPVESYMLTYVADETYGQALTLLFKGNMGIEQLRACVEQLLPSKQRPKHIFRVDTIPTTHTGKPARVEAHLLAEKLNSSFNQK